MVSNAALSLLLIHKYTHLNITGHQWKKVYHKHGMCIYHTVNIGVYRYTTSPHMVGPRNLDQLSPSSYNGVLHNLYVAYLYFSKNRNFHICSQLIYVAFPLLRYLVFNISRNSLFFVFKTYISPSTIYLMRKNKSCLAWYESNVVCQYIIGGGDYCQPLPPASTRVF